MDVIAATKLEDLLAPKGQGRRVNVHVVDARREPKPDFEAMKKVIKGTDLVQDPEANGPRRKISSND